ncbi:Uncharacterized protein AArcCO_1118 [Halalkaliarchaeum sp. AArc-CO]|nr:Uncharacterized protein AArcCO_1118 [Halalkaliarchaeum sp. AArc-CO]
MASRQRRSGAEKAPGIGTQGTVGTPPRSPRRTGDSPTPVRRGPEDPPVRDPAVYAQTDHFRGRIHQQGRYVSPSVVSEAIERGQLRWNTSDGWRFALVRDGVRFVVVVGDTDTPSPVVVTGWTEIDDWETAVGSGRWTPTDVNTIQLRADLSESPDEQIPGRIRPRAVDRPFELGDHRIRTEPGESHVTCVDCGGQFRSKNAILTRHCRR